MGMNKLKKSKRKVIIIISLSAVFVAGIIIAVICNLPCSHKNTVILEGVSATCTQDGLTEGKKCADCGLIIVPQEKISASGHEMDDGVITKKQTCTEKGIKTFTCTKCGYTQTEDIEPHDFTSKVTLEPTCTTEGEMLLMCKDCGFEKEETIPAEGHDWKSMKGSLSQACEKCQRFKISSSDIAPNDWTINKDNQYLQFQNAMVTIKYATSAGVYVSSCPICSSCRISAPSNESKYYIVNPYSPVNETYICDECGKETSVMIKIEY